MKLRIKQIVDVDGNKGYHVQQKSWGVWITKVTTVYLAAAHDHLNEMHRVYIYQPRKLFQMTPNTRMIVHMENKLGYIQHRKNIFSSWISDTDYANRDLLYTTKEKALEFLSKANPSPTSVRKVHNINKTTRILERYSSKQKRIIFIIQQKSFLYWSNICHFRQFTTALTYARDNPSIKKTTIIHHV